MLEEKNDNLQEADGKLEINSTDATTNDAIETLDSETASEKPPANCPASFSFTDGSICG